MKDLIARLNHGVPLATLRAVRDRRVKGPSMLAPVEEDMRKAAELLHEANLIITGLCRDEATFAHYEAAIEWTRKHAKPSHQPSCSEHS